MAAAAVPIVGLIGSLGSKLAGIFGANHQAAVAAEANNLNAAFPQYQKNLVAIVQAVNSGQIDAPTASGAVDESVQEYYAAVHGIIKDSSNGGAACTTADANGKGSNCNGPCTVGCAWVVPWATKVKTALAAGGGTVMFDAVPSHAGFVGSPAWSVSIAVPSNPLQTLSGAVSSALFPQLAPQLGSLIPTGFNNRPLVAPQQQLLTQQESLLPSSLAGIPQSYLLIGGAMLFLMMFMGMMSRPK